jgi:glutathione peroxidase
MTVLADEAYQKGAPDYRSTLTKVKALNPDLLFLVSYVADAITLMRQSREQQRLDVSTLTPGEVLEGRYKFVKKIGKGAFGTVLLMVNTASKCGFTPQYDGLEKLYQQFKDQSFEVLGFPCNQFGAQEPGNADEIAEFCKVNFGVTFPLMAKIDVNGDDASPLFDWMKSEAKGLMGSTSIKWNFTKFLIDREGNVVKRYGPQDTPASIAKDIAKLL